MSTVDSSELARFRSIIERRLGLEVEDSKLAQLGEVLCRRAGPGGEPQAYLARLEDEPRAEELGAIAQELTVPETYFFRNADQFRAFDALVLPERQRCRRSERKLRFLSAGCATGEEPFSLAILAYAAAPAPAWDVSIRAVDVNPAVLRRARRARFSSWALRETPPEVQQRWFRREGRELVLDDAIRALVAFEQRNLAATDRDLWAKATYDAVFCRNVLMYLTPEAAKQLVSWIASALVPGGYLFLGHAETLRGLSTEFRLCHSHGAFYYQRAAGAPAAEPLAAAQPLEHPAAPAAIGQNWVEAIDHAAERIRSLTRPDTGTPVLASDVARHDLGLALEHLTHERFAQASQLISALPSGAREDADVSLLEAVLLVHAGDFARAESLCRRLLERNDLNAGAHYAVALCREGVGDRTGAVEHHEAAAFLDPDFAMPRLHLGLLARKGGDREQALRELGKAEVLLQREDPARLLLFGGGFNRGALIALCNAQLNACGGRE
jgi:chemotaxis protein methyltransferase CheR